MANNGKTNLLNEKLKAKEAIEAQSAHRASDEPLALDDASRVKVLSPARLVAKRFFRNKLAIVGMVLLISLFLMSFVGPIFYPYGQLDKFTAVRELDLEYAVCGVPSSYNKYILVENAAAEDVKNYVDSFIKELLSDGVDSKEVERGGATFIITKDTDATFMLKIKSAEVYVYDAISASVKRGEPAAELDALIKSALSSGEKTVEYGGITYHVNKKSKTEAGILADYPAGKEIDAIVASKLTFDVLDPEFVMEPAFTAEALLHYHKDNAFTLDGKDYVITDSGDRSLIKDASGKELVQIMSYSIRDISGKDSLGESFKTAFAAVVAEMDAQGLRTKTFVFDVPQLDVETKQYVYDENGNQKLESEELTVNRKEVSGEVRYYASYQVRKELYDMYSPPSVQHILGTDGDGYDVFARIMYGGRISLIVGFVVVFLETILGVIMGGIAGFFGGWVDTLIMRLVDIFYCIPTMPIMIIIASVFDKLKVPPYERLMWMMAMLGILGWSGIARLVRGQILSLREQEFMIAAEATGLKTNRRIYKHLVPNVMPQLIVSMTMGLGSVILLESTLSYLGLGVKHPLATWGNIINSVSSIEAMKSYVYIWVPVGILICLAVIAFNFVGDGLRDAFDPKMKR
ncbi:MAG: ABC transporter permease [Clostridia bacterium]|nr:ABC transporter permease [Clostridia bacterium]